MNCDYRQYICQRCGKVRNYVFERCGNYNNVLYYRSLAVQIGKLQQRSILNADTELNFCRKR